MLVRQQARNLARGSARLLAFAPVAALVVAAFFDLGPGGSARASSFPFALRLFDPFVWTCVGRSLLFATAVTVTALGLGTLLGCILGRLGPWLRPALSALALAPLAFGPAYLALGLAGLARLDPRLGGLGAPGDLGEAASAWESAARFAAWLWTTAPCSIAFVACVVSRRIQVLTFDLDDAAAAAGLGRIAAWWTLTRPVVRASAFRASALVFAAALFEPGAPWILGLRRTLGYQIVLQSARLDPFPGLAIWTLIGAALAGIVGSSLHAWGGHDVLGDETSLLVASTFPRRRSLPGALVRLGGGLAWICLAWAPVAGLLIHALAVMDSNDPIEAWPGAVRTLLDRPEISRPLVTSGWLGLAVAAVLLLFSIFNRGFAGLWPLRMAAPRSPWIAAGLLAGAGVLALGRVLTLATAGQDSSGTLAHLLAGASHWLDPARRPELVLVLGVAWAILANVSWPNARTPLPRPVASARDAARAIGIGRLRARLLADPRAISRLGLGLCAAGALAAVNVAPALILAPWLDIRPIGPAVLDLAAANTPPNAHAPLLALVALGVGLLGLAAARASER